MIAGQQGVITRGLPTAAGARGGRIGDIEVLRGLAVLLVMVHHAAGSLIQQPGLLLDFINRAQFAFGVDLFFVISGFVISRTLLDDLRGARDPDGVSGVLRAFWTRRIFRIWPASWLWLALILLGSLIAAPNIFGTTTTNIWATVAAICGFANFRFADAYFVYFYGASYPYWSLSLEEQFYLVLPVAILLTRRLSLRTLGFAVFAVLLVLLPMERGRWTVILRPDGLLWGVLLAICSSHPLYERIAPTFLARRGPTGTLLRLGLVAATVAAMSETSELAHLIGPFGIGGISALGALLVWAASYGRSFICAEGRFKAVMVWVGARSYALYLCHAPIYAGSVAVSNWIGRSDSVLGPFSDLRNVLLALPITFLAADLTHRIVEIPARDYGRRIANRKRRAQSFNAAWWPVAFVLAVPVVVHLPELLGLVSCNPLLITSGLHAAPFSSVFGGVCFIDGNAGMTVQALGSEAASQWLAGSIPWWNHYSGAGLPLASEMQSTAMFLPFVLLLHFTNGMLFLKLILQLLTGLFTFACLRQTGIGRYASSVAAILFSLNSTFACFSDAPIQPIAFLPLLVLGIERCRAWSVQGSKGGEALVAVAIAFSLYAGFPEVAFANGVLALSWALVACWRAGPEARLACGVRICAGGICGILLATPVLLPFLQDLSSSTVSGHMLTVGSVLGAANWPTIILPNIFGPPESDWNFMAWNGTWGSLGPGLMLLALASVLSKPRDGLRIVLAAWIVFTLAAAFRVPGFNLVRSILPGFQNLNFDRYVGASAEFAACVLLAFALDDWAGARLRLRIGTAAAASLALVASAIVVGWPRLASNLGHMAPWNEASWPSGLVASASVLGAILVVVSLFQLMRALPQQASKSAAAALLVIEAAAFFVMPITAGLQDKSLATGSIAYLRDHLGLQRLYVMGGPLAANYGAYFKVAMVNDIYVPLATAWDGYVQHLAPAEMPSFFSGLNGTAASRAADFVANRALFADAAVSYVMVPAKQDGLAGRRGAERMDKVYEDDIARIYRLDGAKPYFEVDGSHCLLTPKNRDRLQADCDGPARLTRREMDFPGWHARVNRKRADITTQGGIFQHIDLPAGHSDVVWRCTPQNPRRIALLFAAGCIGLIAFVLRALRQKQGQAILRVRP